MLISLSKPLIKNACVLDRSLRRNFQLGVLRKNKRRFRRKKMKCQSLMDWSSARVTPTKEEEEKEDRICWLPDDILVSIVSQLNIRESVRTSVLSKRWRYVWTGIPALNFDSDGWCWIDYLSCLPHRDDYSFPKWGCERSYNYSKWVTWVLAQHRGPKLEEFRVFYDLDERYTSVIDDWIQFALSNRLHKLEISLCKISTYMWLTPRPDRCYTLQHRILQPCLNNNSSNMFLGFKTLKILSFKAVNVSDEVVEYLLSACPLLERLSLNLNFALRNIRVIGTSLLLRHLEVVRCKHIEAIELRDTNLVSFTYAGKQPVMLVKDAPKLVELSINCYASILVTGAMFSMFSSCFSQLEILELRISQLRPELRRYIMPVLNNLKQYVLIVELYCEESLFWYLTTIKNWPNLERFVLKIRIKVVHVHSDYKEETNAFMKFVTAYCHPCLKVVEVASYCHTCHFELLKQMIRNFVSLEKIIIDTHDPNPQPIRIRDNGSYIEKYSRKLQRDEEQQLRGFVPNGVKLEIL